MNYPLISEYIESIKLAEDNFDELSYLRPVLDAEGQPVMSSGNFAVVFKMRDERDGKLYAVRCFHRDQEGREESYRLIEEELKDVESPYLVSFRYMDKELFVDSSQTDETEFPVLLMDWVEGITLDKYLRENLDDQYALEMLAYRFSQLAQWLIPQPFAHGDLKPDNILVREDGTLVLVDYDGMYVPAMKGQKARELGSPDFRHPLRTEDDFDEHIDDFPLVSILLSLKAISINPQLLEEYGATDRLLLSEKDYRDISQSTFLKNVFPSKDSELNVVLCLFTIVLENRDSSYSSLYLLGLSEPKEFANLAKANEFCSSCLQNVRGHYVDQYGAIYSHDYKVLLRLPYEIVEYNVREGTEIIANGAFDHFVEWVDHGFVTTNEACLEKIYLPSSVKYITDSAFGGDGLNLIEIGVDKNLDYYKSLLKHFSDLIVKKKPYNQIKSRSTSIYDILGAEYSRDGKNLISLGYLSPDISTYQIKDGVKIINRGAAQNARNIHQIIIPYGVEEILGAAFSGSSLSKISLPVSLRTIGQSAFSSCNKLQFVVIPEGVEYIDSYAFLGCDKLESVTLPSSLVKMNLRVFAVNRSLKTVRFNGTPAFLSDCFDQCQSLQAIHIPIGTRNVFENLLPEYKDVLIEQDEDENFSTKITDEDLANACVDEFGAKYSKNGNRLLFLPKPNMLEEYSIREGTKVICDKAFSFCAQLKKVNIPASVVAIGRYAFSGCSSLISLSIPNGVISIGEYAFSGCRGITSMTIPSGVQKISNGVFCDCVGLTFINFPKGIENIGDKAFYGCNSLKEMIIPHGVKTIGKLAFANCWNLKAMIISGEVEYIGAYAFASCRNMKRFAFVLETVQEIGEGAFQGCSSLENIYLPGSLKCIGKQLFLECDRLRIIWIPKEDLQKFEKLLPEYKQMIDNSGPKIKIYA